MTPDEIMAILDAIENDRGDHKGVPVRDVLWHVLDDVLDTLERALKNGEGDDVLIEVRDYLGNHYGDD